jgi:4-amino-4-deoxy-L-arabinose transferase-like glycosyltransferase
MESKKLNRKTVVFLFLIFVLALGLRARVFSKQMNVMNLSYDPRNYWIMSHQMVDDGIYGYAYDNPSGEPNARVMPGYPLFLAAVYKILGDKYLQITAVRLLQVIISSFSVLLGFLFVKKAFKNDLTALLTALFMAVYPTYVLSTVMLLTETLALFTMLLYFCLSLYAFESGKKGIHFITGMAFGLHLMIRPALLPLFIFPFVFALISNRQGDNSPDCINLCKKKNHSLISIALFFLFQLFGLILVMAPWWIRNIMTLGTFVLTAEGSGNPFLAGTYPYFKDYFTDVTDEIRGNNDYQMAYGIKRLIEGLKTDFWLYVRWFTIGKTAYLFHEPYLCRLLINSEAPSKVIHFFILIPGAIGSVIHAVKSIKSFWFYFYGLTILGLQLMFVPDPRFAYLIMFFIIVGAAHLISYIAGLITRGKRKAQMEVPV